MTEESEKLNSEKLNIEFFPKENETFLFGKQQISMRTYLHLHEKIDITQEYLDNLSGGDPIIFSERLSKSYFVAEHTLKLHLIDILTNINITSLKDDSIITNNLWKMIEEKIEGYDEFLMDLRKIVELQQAKNVLEKSVGTVLDSVAQKIIQLVNKLSELDAETFKKSSEELVQKLDEINNQFPGVAGKPVTRKVKESKKIQ